MIKTHENRSSVTCCWLGHIQVEIDPAHVGKIPIDCGDEGKLSSLVQEFSVAFDRRACLFQQVPYFCYCLSHLDCCRLDDLCDVRGVALGVVFELQVQQVCLLELLPGGFPVTPIISLLASLVETSVHSLPHQAGMELSDGFPCKGMEI